MARTSTRPRRRGLRAGLHYHLELPPAASGDGICGDLVLLTLHGFGNRIRSLAAAWSLAAEMRRRLHLEWRCDDTCGAAFEDLFENTLQNGDTLRVNSLTALSARACYDNNCAFRTKLSVYEGSCIDTVELFSSDLTRLAYDAAPVAALRGSAIPTTLVRGDTKQRVAGAKADRIHLAEQRADGKLKGAFYRNLVPSKGVQELMDTAIERISDLQAHAGLELMLIGVHVRQGDALDKQQQYFFRDLSGGKHNDDFVESFCIEMANAKERAVNEGKRAIFFVASDQERARVTLRERFGAEEVIEIAPPWSEEVSAVDVCDADGGEGRVGRGRRQMQHAVAEWLMLARSELLIRSRKSSFSDEAALQYGVRCVDIG